MVNSPLEQAENDNLESSEVKLTVPKISKVNGIWKVVAKNRKVNKAWEALMLRYPENTNRCYEDLCTIPTTQKPRRVFPLRGKKYQGIWEYEVSSGDRVFYIPDENQMIVFVFYAGKHIKPAPTP